MQAIVIKEPGDESVMQIGEVEAPVKGPNDLRIAVKATAVNRADLLQRRGFYPPPPGASPLLGLECAGEVIGVGADVSGWKPGDRAMALLAGGGYASEVVVDAGSAMKVPSVLSWTEAGAMPEVFLTAYLNIFMLGEARPGASVLIHGGGSGVGTAATTMCKLRNMRVIVTAGSEEKCEQTRRHGADVAINYRIGPFGEAVKEATDGKGVDVILDCIGASYLQQNLDVLALDGILVIIGLTGGARSEINLAPLLMRRQRVIGSTLRTRSNAEKARIVRSFVAEFGEDLEAGRVRPVIEKVFPLAQAAEAHRLVESSRHFGKVCLEI